MSLTETEFLSVLKYTPLISIDLCLIYNNEILLLKRNNDPAKGFFSHLVLEFIKINQLIKRLKIYV